MRTFSFFETLGADIRFAARSLLKNPAFLVVVVSSLALGIAANSTIFSVLDTFLYRPLPYSHPEKLVVIWQTESAHPERTIPPPSGIGRLAETKSCLRRYRHDQFQRYRQCFRPRRAAASARGIRDSEFVQFAGREACFGASLPSNGSTRSRSDGHYQRRVLEARA